MFLFVSQTMQAQGTDPIAAIQQKLDQQFVKIKVAGDGSIVTAGSVLVLQKDGLKMCSIAVPFSLDNTYKNGKLSAGMFSWGLLLGLNRPPIDSNQVPQRTFMSGEKFWVVAYSVSKNGVVFKFWSDPDDNGVRYYTQLNFPFQKKIIPPVSDVMNTIAEVVTVDAPAEAAPAAQSAPPPAPVSDAGPSDDSANSVLGKYIERGKNSDYIELATNGVFFLFQNGKMYSGNYTAEGDALILSGPKIKGQPTFHIIGNTIKYDADGTVYEKPFQATAAPEPSPEPAMAPILPPPPPPASPKTIALGQTKDEVAAILGQPDKIANLGTKEIDYYTDMKVIFIKGKVSDIQ
jgi:hypothetical protein